MMPRLLPPTARTLLAICLLAAPAALAATELPTRDRPVLPEAQTVAAEPPPKAETPVTETAPPAPAAEQTPPVLAYPEPPKAEAPPAASATEAAPSKDEFSAALVHVYLNHPQLQAERKSLEATDEGVAQAISGFRPTATANYDVGRERDNNSSDTWNYNNSSTKSLQVTQPVFRGGSTLADYASARDRVKAGRAQLSALEQQVLFNAIVAYTDVVEKQSVLEVNQNNVDVLSKQLNATQTRFDVGDLTKTDVAQAQARLASAQAAERQALGDLAASRATFHRVIGYEPPETIILPPLPGNLPATPQDATRWAEANNPTLEAARHLENAADSEVDSRTGSVLPSVDIESSMSRRNRAIPGQSRTDTDQLLLNVSIPLYQSGAEWSRIREAKSLAQQAKFNSWDTRDSVAESVTRAWQDFNTAKALITANEQAVKAAGEALEGVRQEHLYGTRTILDVLDTEQVYFSSRVDLVKATVAEKQQAYRLLATIGRLTARELKLAVDLIDPAQHYDKVKYQLIGF